MGSRKYRRPAYVLERMSVPGYPRVFVLGCRAKRVTVLSQQYRAFNLIWALMAEGHLREGDRVGVVGGGIGGMTVAAASMLKGLRVVLAEAQSELIHLQRGNQTRLLHPNIYEWPRAGSEVEDTRLPFLNWAADFTDQVVVEIRRQWDELTSRYNPRVALNTLVRRVEPNGAGETIRIVADQWRSAPCNVAVVAVGFGVEGQAPGLHLPSYWDNEHFGQHTKGMSQKRVFISGLGDGGLIDVLRFKYKEFDHAKFASAVTREAELNRYKRVLLRIDFRTPTTEPEEYLLNNYEKINIPADFAYRFGELRTDTEVFLNGPGRSPLSPNASILHRLIIWSLLRARKLTYIAGRVVREEIKIESIPSGIKYWVPIPDGDELAFDEVVLRHGPAGCLGVLPEIDRAFKGIEESAAADRTRTQLYPDDFYPTASTPAGSAQPPSNRGIISGTSRIPGESPMLPMHSAPDSPSFVRPAVSEASNLVVPELVELRSAIDVLRAEFEANNYLQAQTAAARVEELAVHVDEALTPELRVRAYRAVYDFELMRRERVKAGGGVYDLSRLHELIQRMEHGRH